MTINIKLPVPIYKRNEFGSFDRKADIQIAGDFDSLSEGYSFLRKQIDELLQQANAENAMLIDLQEVEKEIRNKQRSLELLNRDIDIATNQLQNLQKFLERLWIDPRGYSLLIASKPINSAVAGEVTEVKTEAWEEDWGAADECDGDE